MSGEGKMINHSISVTLNFVMYLCGTLSIKDDFNCGIKLYIDPLCSWSQVRENSLNYTSRSRKSIQKEKAKRNGVKFAKIV